MSDIVWKSFKVDPADADWEPATYNVKWEDGREYGRWRRVVAGRGTFMFNAPGAIHGGISGGLTLYIHCCSGEPDEIVSIDLIDFEPKEGVASVDV